MRAPCQVFEQLLQEKEDTYPHESSSCCGNCTLQWLENELVVGHTHQLPSTRTARARCMILPLKPETSRGSHRASQSGSAMTV